MATLSSVLTWEIPCTEELGGLQSMGSVVSRRVSGHRAVCGREWAYACAWLSQSILCMWTFSHDLLPSRRGQWHPTPVLLPGDSHGQRSLVGCSPWGHEESGTTERLPFHFSLSCIGEGNGSPLQCSCLENPRDGGAWWVASVGSHRVGHNWSDAAAAE